MKVTRFAVFLLMLATFMSACTSTKQSATPTKSSDNRPTRSTDGIKSYDEVITSKAEKDEGLFTVYQQDDKLYYAIPDSLLGRDMLLVRHVADVPTDYFGFFSAGAKTAEQVIRFERQKDRILIRKHSFENIADEELPVYKSVQANNFAPILASFDIEAHTEDSNGVVIEMTDFLSLILKPLVE